MPQQKTDLMGNGTKATGDHTVINIEDKKGLKETVIPSQNPLQERMDKLIQEVQRLDEKLFSEILIPQLLSAAANPPERLSPPNTAIEVTDHRLLPARLARALWFTMETQKIVVFRTPAEDTDDLCDTAHLKIRLLKQISANSPELYKLASQPDRTDGQRKEAIKVLLLKIAGSNRQYQELNPGEESKRNEQIKKSFSLLRQDKNLGTIFNHQDYVLLYYQYGFTRVRAYLKEHAASINNTEALLAKLEKLDALDQKYYVQRFSIDTNFYNAILNSTDPLSHVEKPQQALIKTKEGYCALLQELYAELALVEDKDHRTDLLSFLELGTNMLEYANKLSLKPKPAFRYHPRHLDLLAYYKTLSPISRQQLKLRAFLGGLLPLLLLLNSISIIRLVFTFGPLPSTRSLILSITLMVTLGLLIFAIKWIWWEIAQIFRLATPKLKKQLRVIYLVEMACSLWIGAMVAKLILRAAQSDPQRFQEAALASQSTSWVLTVFLLIVRITSLLSQGLALYLEYQEGISVAKSAYQQKQRNVIRGWKATMIVLYLLLATLAFHISDSVIPVPVGDPSPTSLSRGSQPLPILAGGSAN